MLAIRLRLDRRLLDRYPNDDAPRRAGPHKRDRDGEDVARARAGEAARDGAADGLAQRDLPRDRLHLRDLLFGLVVRRWARLGGRGEGVCGPRVLLRLVERTRGGYVDDERVLARARGKTAWVVERA